MSDGNTVVELCAGYGGLFMGLNAVTDARLTAYAEIDPGASAVMARHHPGVPNLGDVKAIDWSSLNSPRWLIGGYPCQPFSDAGKRLGTDDPRHLWPFFVPAIAALQPDFVLFENVRGHVKRGLAEVLADLAELGYGGAWGLFAASDVGAPHQRYRVFILGSRHVAPGFTDAGKPGPAPHLAAPAVGALLPTPEAKLAHSGPDYARMSRPNGGGQVVTTAVTLLPTPAARDYKGADARGPRRDGAARTDAQRTLPGIVLEAMPSDGPNGGPNQRGRRGDLAMPSVVHSREWEFGKYAPAVARWEMVTGTTAPPAKRTGPNGGQRLNPEFAEWMHGVPAGHVTAVPDLTNSAQLQAIGNGVVPLQASYAVSVLMRTLSQLPRKVYAL